MKAKVTRGAGFRGVLNYALGPTKHAQIVGGNLDGSTPRELASEFSVSRNIRPEINKPVWHCSLALPNGDHISADKWQEITADFMARMGFSDHQYVVVQHGDTDHEHVHIVASRIGLDGELWHGQWEARRAIAATQELEHKHGLTLTPGLEDARSEHKQPSKPEIEMAIRTGEAPARMKAQAIIDAALADGPQSASDFVARCEAGGLTVRPNLAKTGRLNGYSFGLDGVSLKGSQLGKAFTLKGLTARGVTYDEVRDYGPLNEAANRASTAAGTEHGSEPGADDREHRHAAGIDGVAESGTSPGSAADRGRDEAHVRNTDNFYESDRSAQRAGIGHPDAADRKRGQEFQAADAGELGRSLTNHQDPAAKDAAMGVPGGRAEWRALAVRATDLAAPADADVLESSRAAGGPATAVSVSQAAKRDAWRQQHRALDAPTYRLTLVGRKEGQPTYNVGKGRGEDGGEKLYSPDAVEKMIPKLSRENAHGWDVYVTPIDDRHHYIVVDDMTPANVQALKSDGYTPVLVQESSENNRQAVIKIERLKDRPDEQSQANRLVMDLNQKYGDPKFSGAIHPFRMAGFANKKPGKEDVFTRVLEVSKALCRMASEALAALRRQADELRQQRAEKQRTERPRPQRAASVQQAPLGVAEPGGEYARLAQEITDAVQRNGMPVDLSRVDFQVAQRLLRRGWSADLVEVAIRNGSPSLDERKHDVDDYVRRTVSRAQQHRCVPGMRG